MIIGPQLRIGKTMAIDVEMRILNILIMIFKLNLLMKLHIFIILGQNLCVIISC